jgi:uncharacterized protein
MPALETPPFRYGTVVEADFFTDRAHEVESLAADARRGQNVVLISQRRFGKTSLVRLVQHTLERDNVLVAYVDLLRAASKERLAAQLANALFGILAPRDQALQRASEIFERLPIRPKLALSPDGKASFEFAGAPGSSSVDIDAVLERLLELPARVAHERGQRVVLIFDEFQEIIDLDPHLPALIRSIFQLQADVAHIFLGSRQHLLRRVFTSRNEPLYRLARALPLGPIPADLFEAFIRERFAAGHSQISRDAARSILSYTECHPNDTQELCYFTWAIAVAEQRPATIDTVEHALTQVLANESARFVEIWESLVPQHRRVLTAVAQGARIFATATRVQHQLGTPTSIQKALARLIERELVTSSGRGQYAVTDTFLRTWLTRER